MTFEDYLLQRAARRALVKSAIPFLFPRDEVISFDHPPRRVRRVRRPQGMVRMEYNYPLFRGGALLWPLIAAGGMYALPKLLNWLRGQ